MDAESSVFESQSGGLEGVNSNDLFLETKTQTCETDFVATQDSEDALPHAFTGDSNFFGDAADVDRLAFHSVTDLDVAMSASPASITAANAIIAFGMLKGHKITPADAVKAYLQSLLNSLAEIWVRLPKEVWPESWFFKNGRPLFRRPVIRLLRSFYGHPEAGAHWERKLEQELLDMGAIKVPGRSQDFQARTQSRRMEISNGIRR